VEPTPEQPRRRGWQPPRWLKIAYVVVVVALGVARIAISSTLLGRAFGVVLILLGLSYARELRSPARDGRRG
jgi:hypothetical protein